MKQTKRTKGLRLDREALRLLSAPRLDGAKGGVSGNACNFDCGYQSTGGMVTTCEAGMTCKPN